MAWAGASGCFQFNARFPVLGAGVLKSIRLLTNHDAARLADKAVTGLVANVDRALSLAESCP